MVGPDRVYHRRGKPVALDEVRTDDGVRPLDLVVDRLADVVQEARQLGDPDVGPDLGRHYGRQVGDLFGVVEDLLSVGGAEAEDAEVSDHLRMKALEPDIEHGGLSFFLDPLGDFQAGFGDCLFNPSRMDPAVDYELVEGDPRHLPADRVKAADDHGLGRVVDDDVDAGRLLQGPDVAALATDDPALHILRRERQD